MKIKFALIGLVSVMALAGCGGKQATKAKNVNGVPSWVLNPSVKQGAVCSQARGIYPIAKAETLAINNCLLQLADKKISGAAQVSKDVQVHKTDAGENVRTQTYVRNEFAVQAAEGGENLSYEIKGKYYDPVQQKVHVWVILK